MKKKEVLYNYIQEKMAEVVDIDKNIISNDRAKHILGFRFRIPKWLQVPVLEEMIDLKLLKRKDQRVLEINNK